MTQVPDSATVKECIATVMSAFFTLPGEEKRADKTKMGRLKRVIKRKKRRINDDYLYNLVIKLI